MIGVVIPVMITIVCFIVIKWKINRMTNIIGIEELDKEAPDLARALSKSISKKEASVTRYRTRAMANRGYNSFFSLFGMKL